MTTRIEAMELYNAQMRNDTEIKKQYPGGWVDKTYQELAEILCDQYLQGYIDAAFQSRLKDTALKLSTS